MKVKIIHKGVNFNADGKGERAVAVGEVIDVKGEGPDGDKIPAWLANKAVPADLIVNPAKKLTKAEQKAADDAERATLTESAKLLGIEITDKMTLAEVREAVAKAGQQ